MHDLPQYHHVASKHDEFLIWDKEGDSMRVE